MERSFELLVREADSVVGANAIARTLNERGKLLSRNDMKAFVACAVGGDRKAKTVALRGLDLIRAAQGRSLAELSDRKAAEYILWLSQFALQRAAGGRFLSAERGETLLTELRKVATTVPANGPL